MAVSVDAHELRQHAVVLASAGHISKVGVYAATRLSAQRVRDTARNGFAGTRHWKQVPRAITFEASKTDDGAEATIGRERGTGGQGALMHLLEYGSTRFGPIKPTLGPALDKNADIYEKAVVAAATAPLGAGIGKMGRLSR